jgi:hypothetical protein
MNFDKETNLTNCISEKVVPLHFKIKTKYKPSDKDTKSKKNGESISDNRHSK